MRIKTGPCFASLCYGRVSHILIALHRRWRLAFVKPPGKPGYRRLYVGPLEIEWFGGATR